MESGLGPASTRRRGITFLLRVVCDGALSEIDGYWAVVACCVMGITAGRIDDGSGV